MNSRHTTRALVACLLTLALTLSLVGCGLSGQHDREASRHSIEAALSELGAPVIGATASELGSGRVIYLNVSVRVEPGTQSISPEMFRGILEIIAHGAPSRYPSVDIDVSTPDFKPVSITDIAVELGAPNYAITGAGTLGLNRIDLVEWVATFP